MKPGLAILPLEVWADVSEHPLITRQMMAQIADNNGDRNFTNKLQKLLHVCGKQTLHYLKISPKPTFEPNKSNQLQLKYRASLAVAHDIAYSGSARLNPAYKDCKFPADEIPENIKKFKRLIIGYFDDEVVLNFLHKIKPIFNNVSLRIGYIESAENLHLLLAHLLPMIASIRAIRCNTDHFELLEHHFPGTMARSKELDLLNTKPAFIPAYLNWLCAPQEFVMHGPRFLHTVAGSETGLAIMDAVRKQFLASRTPSTFVIFLQLDKPPNIIHEFNLENATTKEQLTVRKVWFYRKYVHLPHLEILRHPMGDDAKIREWIKQRAFFDKSYNEEEQVMWIWSKPLGRITQKVNAIMVEDETNGEESVPAGP